MGKRFVSAPLLGLIRCFDRQEDVPQDMWELGEWRGFIESENATYYETPDNQWYAVRNE